MVRFFSVILLLFALARVGVGIKKCLPIPNSALSPTCLSLALTPTTACLDTSVDFSDRDSSTLAQAKLDRRAECDDPRRRVTECPNDPREADPCDRDGPSLATHCGGDLTLCGSDDECARRLVCWERCFPCNDRDTCDKLVEIGIVAKQGNRECIGYNRCYQVDVARAGNVCAGITPGRLCANTRPDMRYVTQDYINNLREEWLTRCDPRREELYKKEECPNDPSKAQPCTVAYPEPTAERLCYGDRVTAETSMGDAGAVAGAIAEGTNATGAAPSSPLTECIVSMDCAPVLKKCWSSCYPCKSRAECERLVAVGEVAEEGVGECSSAGRLYPISAIVAVALVALGLM